MEFKLHYHFSKREVKINEVHFCIYLNLKAHSETDFSKVACWILWRFCVYANQHTGGYFSGHQSDLTCLFLHGYKASFSVLMGWQWGVNSDINLGRIVFWCHLCNRDLIGIFLILIYTFDYLSSSANLILTVCIL